MKPCHTCQRRRCRVESTQGGHVIIWGCGRHGIRFGYQWQYAAGENMPEHCPDQVAVILSQVRAK